MRDERLKDVIENLPENWIVAWKDLNAFPGPSGRLRVRLTHSGIPGRHARPGASLLGAG
jgi:hypothetical protein